jgi:exodeoxyribonuclease-3
MKIATWNVNSLNARIDNVTNWLSKEAVDILCLQETKLNDEIFENYRKIFRDSGYHAYHNGTGQYNGVAVLSKEEPQVVYMGFKQGEPNLGVDYPECRLLSLEFNNLIVYSIYVPNGRDLHSVHMDFKIKWFNLLDLQLQREIAENPNKLIVLCGDFNVALTDDDVKNIAEMEGSTHVSAKERDAMSRLIGLGFLDIGNEYQKDKKIEQKFRFTWWDYRQLAFQKNNGMRIDYLLLRHRALADKTIAFEDVILDYHTDRDERKKPRPSDHIPIVATIDTDQLILS